MAVTINWGTKVINIPRADMSILQLTPFEIRELDVNQFRLDLRALEAGEDGMPFPDTHSHVTEKILSGISYARFVEIINGYTVEFEDGQYGVSLINANNNILDVKVANQVSVLANNSGGLIGSEAINDQSYLGAQVWIDIDNGNIGAVYPKGTPTDPSNNWEDSYTLATNRNLVGFHLNGTLNYFTESSDPMNGFDFTASSALRSVIVLDGRDTSNCTFRDIVLIGTLNGEVNIKECVISVSGQDLTNFEGAAGYCALGGNIILEETATGIISFVDCKSSVAGNAKPMVDCNDTLADVQFRNYTGGLKISNITNNINVSIDFLSGTLEIDSSCTSGTIVVGGIANVIDNSASGCIVILERTVATLTEALKVKELHQLQGLDASNPMTVTPTQRTAGDIDLDISGDGENISIVTRQ